MNRRLAGVGPIALALLALLGSALLESGCGPGAPPDGGSTPGPGAAALLLPALVAVGPQATCVTGASPACAGDGQFQIPSDLGALAGARGVTFGLRHGCLLDRDHRPVCWGDASEGQMGAAPETEEERCSGRPCRPRPHALAGAPRLGSIDAGWFHTCGVAEDGRVLCWGDDALDQLGRSAPGPGIAPVEGLAGPATQVSAGGLHTCALLADGTVSCWGDGSAGQLGQDESLDSATPVPVQGLASAATRIDAGGYHTCALLTDGGVACWGENRFGQLGDGTRTTSSGAVRVVGLAGSVRAVDVGFSFSCAVLVSGAVQCWGSNELGELGQGFDERPPAPGSPAPPPATVKGLERGVARIHVSGNHACAELVDGSIVCWGANELGQLGDGTVAGRDVPVAWKGRGGEVPRPPLAPSPAERAAIEGFDVSYHSGRVDWRAAAERGHHFGLTLATAGVDFLDPFFVSHWERMRQAGLRRGAYHFFVPDDDPEAQARIFLSRVLFEPGDLVPVVDVETPFKQNGDRPPDDLAERLLAFLRVVEREVGAKPIIYTGPTFWNRQMDDRFGNYPLWIAEYGVDAPHVPAGWKRWHLWQWRGDADLPEVAPIVDLDRLHPETHLDDLLIPEPEAVSDAGNGSGAAGAPAT